MTKHPRIAIVSDPLVQRGGAERLVESLAEAFPEAPIYAILYSEETGPASLKPRIRASWLNAVPGAKKRHRMFLPLYRSAIESLDVSEFDVIISSHHTVGKGVLTRADQLHICYCHTPMRALWERPIEELETLRQPGREIASKIMSHLRVWDAITANRPQKFIANSGATQRRISTYYRRESEIVFPPIDMERFTLGEGNPEDYYLVASRPVPYKRIDIAIAATAAMGRRLKIVGGVHELGTPPPHVDMLGHVSDSELRHLMRGARALMLPQIEDFGMAPLEANACGTPIVAYGVGGALDSVIDGVTGVLVDKQDPEAFAAGMRRLESLDFSPQALRAHAMRFSKERFIANMQRVVSDAWAEHTKPRRPQLVAPVGWLESAEELSA